MSNQERKQAYADKSQAELAELEQAGCVLAGNGYSSVLLLKGDMDAADADGLLTGPDGAALRAALGALGYEPEDWCGLATVNSAGQALAPDTLRLAISTLDPSTLLVLDESAAAAVREAYAPDLAGMEDVNAALLVPGVVFSMCGMRTLALGGFAAALANPEQKQLMWARLKLIPPASEPYLSAVKSAESKVLICRSLLRRGSLLFVVPFTDKCSLSAA